MLGVVVTYFINVLRIVTIFVIGINGGDWMAFHNIYGQLYSITWIVSYPLLIIGSQMLWAKMRNRRMARGSLTLHFELPFNKTLSKNLE
jgi:exosortase/archaeosortase family protein